MTGPRIGLVHALHASMAPVETAFAEDWPQAQTVSLFDQSLYLDYNAAGGMTDEIAERVGALLRHSERCGARAILFTGSLFGAAVETARATMDIPVLASYEAMIQVAFRHGHRLGIVATVPDTARLIADDIERYASAQGYPCELETRLVASAMEALQGGDRPRHDQLVANAAAELKSCDAILLSQFSMAPVLKRLDPDVADRTLTAPAAAVARIRELLRD